MSNLQILVLSCTIRPRSRLSLASGTGIVLQGIAVAFVLPSSTACEGQHWLGIQPILSCSHGWFALLWLNARSPPPLPGVPRQHVMKQR